MKRPITFILIAISCSFPAHARSSQWDQESPAQHQQEEARAQLDDVLRTQAHLHDAYLQAALVGTKDTVPLLIERLRQDFAAVELGPRSGNAMGFDCAQIHLIDALRRVWPPVQYAQGLALQGQLAAVSDIDGALWLVNLSSCPP